ncbi:MAG: ATP-binding protein [Candidatus Saccharimonadales bacterium]
MNRLDAFKRQLRLFIFASMVACTALVVCLVVAGQLIIADGNPLVYVGIGLVSLAVVWAFAVVLTKFAAQPLSLVWQAVLHVVPEQNSSGLAAPALDDNKIAPELVTSLVLQIYQLASSSPSKETKKVNPLAQIVGAVMNSFPLPVFAIDKNQMVIYANEAAAAYLGLTAKELLKQSFYSILDLAFSDDNTLDSWLQDSRANKATASRSWQRVRLKLADQKTLKQFDMAASFSNQNPDGVETVVTIFDQTVRYGSEDQSLDFLALAVHELRTPLTALRGYVEVFEDELAGKLDPELTGFMQQMGVATKQLTAFINNVLNVARIQEGQLSLQLHSENWGLLVQEIVHNLALPAKIHNKVINYRIDGNVPLVGVDKVSITEVINNLVDNAFKYSGDSHTITIHSSLGQDGMVETTVHDDGVGIPEAVMPTLFEKFQRNHRNQAKIGGTGLGLYLCAALVKAHGGNIWVKSKEGEGATIGFSLQPYSQLAAGAKNGDNNEADIVRNAHGWIKNHSLYRR